MTIEELKIKLISSGLPVAYRSWPENAAPTLPYLVYYEESVETLPADGVVYYKIGHIVVELYSKTKNMPAETALEKALQGLHWQKTNEQYLDTEHMLMCSYEFEV